MTSMIASGIENGRRMNSPITARNAPLSMPGARAKRSCRARLAAALLILPALAGCTSIKAAEGPVRLRRIAYVNGPRVRVDRMIEDSRCPAGTQCIWAGRLVVRATVFGGGWSKQLDLTLGVPVDIADGKLTLVGAVPDRPPGRHHYDPRSYRFTLDFQGGL
ncbi:hypothetical protein PX554_09665 [Sphingomonas sp. H39-1-10]|uniref:hypothetical protein n=1 Tax=Sphingomonas pollutisoli TaxID=3030829 RepID=UPI0023B94722|nr:hypothetical protein [Sphingomonas pollutisoli]MDF0488397.1 hypothetical protein [Sphingomonas pollutisoli]